MVKRQKEKQYQSAREQREYSQIRSGSAALANLSSVQRRLPFTHCALTLTPFQQPVCNRTGIIFDNMAILPFLLKHKIDPVSGESMTSRDLITLNMDKDEEGRWQCPVLTKPLSDHAKIVAIIQPGGGEANVFSYEAYHELNIKSKNYEDLLSGARFDKTKDVLILNDPVDEDFNKRREIQTFYHVVHSRQLEQDQSKTGEIKLSMTASRVLEQLEKSQQQKQAERSKTKGQEAELAPDPKRIKVLASDVTGIAYTTGHAAASLTSTATMVASANETREATLEEILQAQFKVMRRLKKKGYVRLRTSLGDITLELHCDWVPRTCVNFLGLCQAGSYNDSPFHRLIPNFMIQGGKPKEEREEESIWGGAFVDEFDDRLRHSGVGVLSMANAGQHTNRRQFFITFKSCPHLDRKHSVFGMVVDGLDALKKMERVATDRQNQPQTPITILGTDVLFNPAQEAADLEQKRLEGLSRSRQEVASLDRAKTKLDHSQLQTQSGFSKQEVGVGRYLK